MKQTNKTVSFRTDTETDRMLEELEQHYKEEAERYGLQGQTKSQIIKEAIKTLYASKINANMQSGYLDLLKDQIQQVNEPMIQASTRMLNEQIEAVQMALLKLSLQMKLELYAQNADSISKEEIKEYLKSDYSYTEAINEYTKELLNLE